MRVDSAKLQALLKQRYGTPRVLLQHLLGQDAGLVAPGGGTDPAMALRLEIERILGDGDLDLDERAVAKILAILDQHAPLGAVDPADPNAGRARELAGTDEADAFEALRELLASAGMTAADVEKAVSIAARGLPQNALRGGFGGRLGTDSARVSTSFAARHPECARINGVDIEAHPRRRKLAQDKASTAGAMSFAARHPDVARCW